MTELGPITILTGEDHRRADLLGSADLPLPGAGKG